MKKLLRAAALSGIALLSPGKSFSEDVAVSSPSVPEDHSVQMRPDSEFFTENLPPKFKKIMEGVRDSALSDLIPDEAIIRTVEAVRREPGMTDPDGLGDNAVTGANISYELASSIWQSHFCDLFRQAGIDCDAAWYRKNRGDIFLRAGYDIDAAVASAFARIKADPVEYAYYGSLSFSGEQLFSEIRRRLEDPKALGQLYNEKKPVLIETLSSCDKYNLDLIRSWLKNLEENVFPMLRENESRKDYVLTEDLTKRMQKNPVSMEDLLNDTRADLQRAQLRDARGRLYSSLGEKAHDIDSALFFFGLPKETQEEWKDIIRDLRQELQNMP